MLRVKTNHNKIISGLYGKEYCQFYTQTIYGKTTTYGLPTNAFSGYLELSQSIPLKHVRVEV
jgi:hypothetical protein